MKQRYGKYACTRCHKVTPVLESESNDAFFVCNNCGHGECEFAGDFFWKDDGNETPEIARVSESKTYSPPSVEVRADAKQVPEEERVYIRRQWNHWEIAYASLNDLDGVRWDTISGGYREEAPKPFIHAYIWCSDIVGRIGHSCSHGEGPHKIKVCVVEEDNTPEIYQALSNVALF